MIPSVKLGCITIWFLKLRFQYFAAHRHHKDRQAMTAWLSFLTPRSPQWVLLNYNCQLKIIPKIWCRSQHLSRDFNPSSWPTNLDLDSTSEARDVVFSILCRFTDLHNFTWCLFVILYYCISQRKPQRQWSYWFNREIRQRNYLK